MRNNSENRSVSVEVIHNRIVALSG